MHAHAHTHTHTPHVGQCHDSTAKLLSAILISKRYHGHNIINTVIIVKFTGLILQYQ